MGIDNLTDTELEDKANEFLNPNLSTEQQTELEKELNLNQPSSTEPSKDELIATVEIDGEPESGGDTSSPSNHQPETDTSKGQPQPTQPEISDEQYNAIIKANPSLAKYPKDKFISELAKAYSNLETKLGAPKDPEPPPITDFQLQAQINRTVLETTEKLVGSDADIVRLLTVKDADGVLRRLPLPVTEEQWSDFMDNYPARYTEIKSRAREIFNDVKQQTETRMQKMATAPQENEKRGLEFIKRIEDYYLGINSNLSEDEKKLIASRTESFWNKAIANQKRYYQNDNGVLFLDPEVMFADYVSQNIDLATKLMSISATNKHAEKFESTANKIRQGVSMKTTGNSGGSKASNQKINVNILSDTDRSRMSDDVLKSLIHELEK